MAVSVAFDAVGPSSAGARVASGTSLTWSHTCSGTARLLIVGVVLSTNTTVSNVKYNGVTMTQVSAGSVQSGGTGGTGSAQLYYLTNPALGANNVVVTSGASGQIIAGSTSFTNVNQASPIGNVSFNWSRSLTDESIFIKAGVASSTGNMVVDVLACGSTLSDSNQTSRWLKNQDLNTSAGNGAQATAPGANGVVMTRTMPSATGDDWAIIVAEIVAGGYVTAWLTA
ncbi:MAG TPA: hypothetical protein VLF40_02675 [Candidatus Saccharimonadales bacterium]|nr:hypothetical protein [Candidatus Saccharimonadales bacterium]